MHSHVSHMFAFVIFSLLTFKAHDGPIKCIALDPHEELFVTGSADGDIKVKLIIYLLFIKTIWLNNKTSFEGLGPFGALPIVLF